MKKGSIYRIVDNRTEKTVYVGQHWYSETPYDSYMVSGGKLKKVYKKEGKENFRKELIIWSLEYQKDMDRLEQICTILYMVRQAGFATPLPASEIEALKEMRKKLGPKIL